MKAGLAGVVWLAMGAVAMTGQHREQNPFSSREAFEEGRFLYRLNCGVCHGMEGKSGRGARLAVREHRRGDTDAELFRVIQNGVSGTEMPGVWLDEDSIWKILLVVRSFEVDSGDVCASSPGDRLRGESVYQSSGCRGCHRVGSEGGRLGPDLTHLGLNYSRAQLGVALLDPAKDIGLRYRTVRVSAAGEKVEGVLRNEDAYSVHLMDRRERLRSFQKSETESVEKPGGSLMPAYGGLSEIEMKDLLAYLCSLRGAEEEEAR